MVISLFFLFFLSACDLQTSGKAIAYDQIVDVYTFLDQAANSRGAFTFVITEDASADVIAAIVPLTEALGTDTPEIYSSGTLEGSVFIGSSSYAEALLGEAVVVADGEAVILIDTNAYNLYIFSDDNVVLSNVVSQLLNYPFYEQVLRDERVTYNKEGEFVAGEVCTEQYDPVCGVDGVTYSNSCKAGVAGVDIAYAGECVVCGDSVCDASEDSTSCPQDCGCPTGQTLQGDVCVVEASCADYGYEEGEVGDCCDASCSSYDLSGCSTTVAETCEDSDGDDKFTQGSVQTTSSHSEFGPFCDGSHPTTSSPGGGTNDMCEGNVLVEQVCSPTQDSVRYDCEFGCQDGACLQEAPSCNDDPNNPACVCEEGDRLATQSCPDCVAGANCPPCTASYSCSSPEPVCGNAVVETGEQCDDGNDNLYDGCGLSCNTCGYAQPDCINAEVQEVGDTDGDGCGDYECVPIDHPVCTEQYDPVCGVDGVTYSNSCKAGVAGVDIAYAGECEVSCETQYECGEWECALGQQTRVCVDVSDCNAADKVETGDACELACTEADWNCDEWSVFDFGSLSFGLVDVSQQAPEDCAYDEVLTRSCSSSRQVCTDSLEGKPAERHECVPTCVEQWEARVTGECQDDGNGDLEGVEAIEWVQVNADCTEPYVTSAPTTTEQSCSLDGGSLIVNTHKGATVEYTLQPDGEAQVIEYAGEPTEDVEEITEFRVVGLPLGDYTVRVSMDGYDAVEETVTVTVERTVLDVSLLPHVNTLLNRIVDHSLSDAWTGILGSEAAASDNIGMLSIAAGIRVANVVLDTAAAGVTGNVMLVGGPCANIETARVLGIPHTIPDCYEQFRELLTHNKGSLTQLVRDGDRYALVVAGLGSTDTRRAAEAVRNFNEHALFGQSRAEVCAASSEGRNNPRSRGRCRAQSSSGGGASGGSGSSADAPPPPPPPSS